MKCVYACCPNVHVALVRETARQLGTSLTGKLIDSCTGCSMGNGCWKLVARATFSRSTRSPQGAPVDLSGPRLTGTVYVIFAQDFSWYCAWTYYLALKSDTAAALRR